jgi:dihydrofolate reductase
MACLPQVLDSDEASKMPKVTIIAALAESNRVIGLCGKLPWSISEDLQRFKRLTLNHTVIMGRKTWEFDIQRCPLRHRVNVIVTSQFASSDLQPICENDSLGVWFARSLSEALRLSANQEKVFIIGGASIYTQSIDLADTLELTIVEGNYEGDVFFPEYRNLVDVEFKQVNVELRDGYRFETYDRIV